MAHAQPPIPLQSDNYTTVAIFHKNIEKLMVMSNGHALVLDTISGKTKQFTCMMKPGTGKFSKLFHQTPSLSTS